MYAHNQALLARLMAFDIDGRPVEQTFENRLGHECGWPRAMAKRVVEEYRKFVYLAMTAGHPVTPSDEVDQAWHLHMTYTESYWTRLCGQVLPRPLHHNPTTGGVEEDAKFADWYERTLASYRSAFACEPPAEAWPAGAVRFDPRRKFRRVRVMDHWLVPRRPATRIAQACGAALGLAMLGGATSDAGKLVVGVGVIVGAVAFVGIAALILTAVLRNYGKRPGPTGDAGDGGGCGGASFIGCAHSSGHRHDHDSGGASGHGHGHDAVGHDSDGAGGHGDAGGHSGCSSGGGDSGGGCGGGCSS